MSIKIIETTNTDLLAKLNCDVQRIHHELEPEIFKPFDEISMKQLFDTLLEHESIKAYIAQYNDQDAAYMLLDTKEYADTPFRYGFKVVHIDQICVDSKFKGKGIGKALVDFSKGYAKNSGIKRVEMNFWTDNCNSGEFFRSQGFKNYNERLAINL